MHRLLTTTAVALLLGLLPALAAEEPCSKPLTSRSQGTSPLTNHSQGMSHSPARRREQQHKLSSLVQFLEVAHHASGGVSSSY